MRSKEVLAAWEKLFHFWRGKSCWDSIAQTNPSSLSGQKIWQGIPVFEAVDWKSFRSTSRRLDDFSSFTRQNIWNDFLAFSRSSAAVYSAKSSINSNSWVYKFRNVRSANTSMNVGSSATPVPWRIRKPTELDATRLIKLIFLLFWRSKKEANSSHFVKFHEIFRWRMRSSLQCYWVFSVLGFWCF